MDKLQFCNHETVDEGGVGNCENFCVAYSLKIVATCQLRLCPLTWDPNELERVCNPAAVLCGSISPRQPSELPPRDKLRDTTFGDIRCVKLATDSVINWDHWELRSHLCVFVRV